MNPITKQEFNDILQNNTDVIEQKIRVGRAFHRTILFVNGKKYAMRVITMNNVSYMNVEN